jgi:hypothetical protein
MSDGGAPPPGIDQTAPNAARDNRACLAWVVRWLARQGIGFGIRR